MANEEEQSPDDLSASLRMYSQALVRSGKPDEAVASARKAIAVKDAPAMRLDLAIALFANGQVAEAEKELDPLVARKSDHGATLYWKYRCLKSRKNDKEALTVAVEARDALTAEVDDKLMDRGDLHFLLAELSTDLGDPEAAQEERAIAAALHVTRHWPAKK